MLTRYLLLSIAVSFSHCLSPVVFFRKDYTLLRDQNAFYKLHTIRKPFSEAIKTCHRENAELFLPRSMYEANAVKPLKGNEDIYVAAHDMYMEGVFVTLNGTLLSDVYTNWEPGEPNNNDNQDCATLNNNMELMDLNCGGYRQFICKKYIDGLSQNVICETYDMEYSYEADLGKCYKYHSTPKNWYDAYSQCHHEDARLVVINSNKEAKYVRDRIPTDDWSPLLMTETPKIHIGMSDIVVPGMIVTLDGVHPSIAGYEVWSLGMPNVKSENSRCGTMLILGELNMEPCESNLSFVCEKTLVRNISRSAINTQ